MATGRLYDGQHFFLIDGVLRRRPTISNIQVLEVDTMPQAIKLTDVEGRSCFYVPITQDGKVVDSQGFSFDSDDD